MEEYHFLKSKKEKRKGKEREGKKRKLENILNKVCYVCSECHDTFICQDSANSQLAVE